MDLKREQNEVTHQINKNLFTLGIPSSEELKQRQEEVVKKVRDISQVITKIKAYFDTNVAPKVKESEASRYGYSRQKGITQMSTQLENRYYEWKQHIIDRKSAATPARATNIPTLAANFFQRHGLGGNPFQQLQQQQPTPGTMFEQDGSMS